MYVLFLFFVIPKKVEYAILLQKCEVLWNERKYVRREISVFSCPTEESAAFEEAYYMYSAYVDFGTDCVLCDFILPGSAIEPKGGGVNGAGARDGAVIQRTARAV